MDWHISAFLSFRLEFFHVVSHPSNLAVVLLQALAAHLLNMWDKTLLFRSCAAQSGCSTPRQLLLLLGIRASARLSLPVLKENLSRVLRGAGGAGAGLGTTIHLSSAEEVADDDSDAVSRVLALAVLKPKPWILKPCTWACSDGHALHGLGLFGSAVR